jgi:hypothetical protein
MEADERKCPFCAETIKKEAVKCRYCGEKIEPESQPGIRPEPAESLNPVTNLRQSRNGCLIGCGTIIAVCIGFVVLVTACQQIDWAAHPEHKAAFEKEQKESEDKQSAEQKAAQDKENEDKKAQAASGEEQKNHTVYPGEKAFLNAGAFVYDSLESVKAFRDSMSVHDDKGATEVAEEGHMTMLPDKIKVLVLDTKSQDFEMYSQVRTLSGKGSGTKLWVKSDSLSRK